MISFKQPPQIVAIKPAIIERPKGIRAKSAPEFNC
jgi:hypothetical protein